MPYMGRIDKMINCHYHRLIILVVVLVQIHDNNYGKEGVVYICFVSFLYLLESEVYV